MTVYTILTAVLRVLRGLRGEKAKTLRKDEICENTLVIYMNYLPGYGLALHIVRDDHIRQSPQVTGHISCHQLASYLSGGGGQDDDNVLAT